MKFTCQLSVASFNIEDFENVQRSLEKSLKKTTFKNLKFFGPIALHRKERLFTVNRSPHGNKKARDQFFLITYQRLWQIQFEGLSKQEVHTKLLNLFNQLSSYDSISFSWKLCLNV